jgi:hypothetical protein
VQRFKFKNHNKEQISEPVRTDPDLARAQAELNENCGPEENQNVLTHSKTAGNRKDGSAKEEGFAKDESRDAERVLSLVDVCTRELQFEFTRYTQQ